MLNYKNTYLFICVFLINFESIAQTDSLIFYPVNNTILQQYDIRRLSAGKDGKLWLSTGNGLVSYDGNDIHAYLPRPNDSTSLSGHSLSRTFIDKYGNLYVVIIADGQIDYFDTRSGKVERFKLHIEKEDSSAYNLRFPYIDILIDDNGLWCGRPDMGFIYYDRTNKKTRNFSLLSTKNPNRNSVNAIREDQNNSNLLWLGTQDGIYSFNKKTNQLSRNFTCSNTRDSMEGDINLLSIDMSHADTIWFGSREGRGIGCYDMKTGKYTIYPLYPKESETNSVAINSMQNINNEEYLIAIEDQFPLLFNTKTKKYSFISKSGEDSLPQQRVSHALKDSLGNIWCLSYGKLYLAKSKNKNLQTVAVHDKYYKDRFMNAFRKVIWDENRKVYYAAFHMSDGIFVFDEKINLIRSIPAPPYKNPVFGFIEAIVVDIGLDSYGRLWLSGDRLSIYDNKAQKMIPVIEIRPELKSFNQRLRNMVFRGNFLYALSADWSSQYLYRLNLANFTCDSILLSEIPLVEKQQPIQLGPLEMDSTGELAYVSNKNVVFQYNLISRTTRKVIELTDQDKPYAHLANFHWYNVDDNNNLWVSSLSKTWIFNPKNLAVIDSFEREKNTWYKQSRNLDGTGIMYFTNSTSQDLYDYKTGKHYKLTMKDGIVAYDNNGPSYANNILFVGYDNFMQHIPLTFVINKGVDRTCYLSNIQIFNKSYATDSLPQHLHTLNLTHDNNYITLTFSSTEYDQPEGLEYRYKLDGVNKDWVYAGYLNRTISYTNLAPGDYTFHASVKNDDGTWSDNNANLQIIIIPAWWQTSLFKILLTLTILAIILGLVYWRIKAVRKQEQVKARYEKELLELEAKALRAQMNPHFIFNCLNSIKSLINKNENEKAARYLTTFSKLIRTLFQNSDRREISLYEEIETCKLYAQLEKMRFGDRINFDFEVDESIDLKDVKVPALIIQPFIENAIWHGIVPKESGGKITVAVREKDRVIECIIDDNGIGRELSRKYKALYEANHESKGIGLTRTRLELDKILNNRDDKVQIIDKSNGQSEPAGTTVVLSFGSNA